MSISLQIGTDVFLFSQVPFAHPGFTEALDIDNYRSTLHEVVSIQHSPLAEQEPNSGDPIVRSITENRRAGAHIHLLSCLRCIAIQSEELWEHDHTNRCEPSLLFMRAPQPSFRDVPYLESIASAEAFPADNACLNAMQKPTARQHSCYTQGSSRQVFADASNTAPQSISN